MRSVATSAIQCRFSAFTPRADLHAAEADLWLVPLDVDENSAGRLGAVLSQSEIERAARYRRPTDQSRFAAAHGWLRLLLAQRLGRDPRSLEFAQGPSHKPYLLGREVHFNLSHSGGRALIGISGRVEIGVDIERLRPMKDARDLAKRFFSAGEQADLERAGSAQEARCFFDCWTRKEAYVKALGDGISHGLDRFRVSCLPDAPAAVLEVEGRADSRWSLIDLRPDDKWAAAAALPAPDVEAAAWVVETPAAAIRSLLG